MSESVLDAVKNSVKIEGDELYRLYGRVDDSFVKAIDVIYSCKGRVIFSGIGKSGLIAKKIASTLSSIGVPSLFVHPTDAAHGDLGMITSDDAAVVLSNSGTTQEVVFLFPILKRFGVPIVAIVGNLNSELAKRSDIVLDASINREASAISLVPMSSTTVALAIGDALTAGLIVKKNFKENDFAILHPGGAIGKKLIMRVSDLMHTGSEIPKVTSDTTLNNCIYEMSSKGLGMTIVVDGNGSVKGIITDGDLRRAMEQYKQDIFSISIESLMNISPKTVYKDALAVKAAGIMEKFSITSLIVENNKGAVEGIIHLHDILKAGIL